MGILSNGTYLIIHLQSTVPSLCRAIGPKEQPWKAFVVHQITQAESYDKHEAFKNQVGIKKPWGEWLHDYMGIVASPKTPAPPPTEVRYILYIRLGP